MLLCFRPEASSPYLYNNMITAIEPSGALESQSKLTFRLRFYLILLWKYLMIYLSCSKVESSINSLLMIQFIMPMVTALNLGWIMSYVWNQISVHISLVVFQFQINADCILFQCKNVFIHLNICYHF